MELQSPKSSLNTLLNTLASESFSIEQGFLEMHLEQIGEVIEECRTYFENPESLTDEFIAKMESFEKCKALYCLILLELELSNKTELPTATLSELLGSHPTTGTLSLEEEHTPLSDKTMISMGILTPTHPERMEEDFPILEPIAPFLSHEKLSQAITDTTATRTKSSQAIAFTELATQLQKGFVQWENSYLRKTIIQNLCWALESELFFRIKPGISSFWENRMEAISPLLRQGSYAIELAPSLKEGLEEKAAEYSHWLYESRFPTQGLITTLRYFLSVPQIETLNPAPLDLAALLLLFGSTLTLGLQFQNLLGIEGLEEEEIVELSFRLTRIQRLKAKILSPHHDCVEDDYHTIEDDVQSALVLVLKLSCEHRRGFQEVA